MKIQKPSIEDLTLMQHDHTGASSGGILQLGQETTVLCRNNSGSTIIKGTPVMFGGTLGNDGRILAIPAIADGTHPNECTLGIATENIADGEDGYVNNFGKIRNLDTTGALSYDSLETWNDGDILYIDPVNAGYLTNVRPSTPNQAIPVAAVIYAHSNGTLFVRPTWHDSFNTLNDTPSSYSGNMYKLLRVNTNENGLEYTGVTIDASDNVIIPGNLTVNGVETIINTEILNVEDKNIEIGSVTTPTDNTADGGGITLLGATNKTITWVKSKLAWVFNQAVEIAGNLNVIGNISVSGTVDGRDVSADGAKLDNIANSKGQINGYASLDGSGKVPSTQLPSYVDDVIEGYFNTVDSKFYVEDTYVTEISGETGKIYVSLDTNKSYRWSGSAFIYITSGAVDSVNGETGLVDLKIYKCDDLVTLTNLLSEKTGNILIELTKNIDLPTTTFTINENLENIWIRNYDFNILHREGGQIIFSASNNCTISILSNIYLSGMGGCNVQLDSVGFSMILRLRYFSSYVSSFTKTVGTTGTVLIEFGTGYHLPNGETLDTFELNSRWFTPTVLDKLLAESTTVTEIANDSEFFFFRLGLKRIRWSKIKDILNSLYQSILVSGTNIKTINSESILGAGNIDIAKPIGLENSLLTANSTGDFISSGIYKVSTIADINSAIEHAITTGNTKLFLIMTELSDGKTGNIIIPVEALDTLFIFVTGNLGRWGNITFVNNSATNHDIRFLDTIDLIQGSDYTWTTATSFNVYLTNIRHQTAQTLTRAGEAAIYYESKSDNTTLLGGSWVRTKWRNLLTKEDVLIIANNLSDVSDKQVGLNNLTQVAGATNEYVLTKDTATGNAIWKAAGGKDGKVKYDADDTTAGYLSEKIIAGNGITLSEGVGGDENKMVITNSRMENVQYFKTITYETPTSSDNITIFRTDVDITVQEVISVSTGSSASTTYQLFHDPDRGATGNTLTTSTITAGTTAGDTATLSDATIPANSWIWLETTGATGTNVSLTIDIRYTED